MNVEHPTRFGENGDPSNIFNPLMVLDKKTEIHKAIQKDLKSLCQFIWMKVVDGPAD